MKINLKSCLTALIMAGATSTSFAQAIVINDQNDLAANSNLAGDPSAYILDGDIFTVDGVFNISGTGRPNLVIDKAATEMSLGTSGAAGQITAGGLSLSNGKLILGGAQSRDALVLNRNGLNLSGGEIQATGGTSGGSDGLYINAGGLRISEGDLNATGGSGNFALGVRIEKGGVVQDGGTITATTGSGREAHGLLISGGGGYTLNGGQLTAISDSSQSTTIGVRVDSGNYVQNGGVLNAQGGNGNTSSGFIVLSGLFQINDGEINAVGGGGSYAYGIDVRNEVSMRGGAVNLTGGTYNTAYGLGATNYSFSQTGGSLRSTGGGVSGAHGLRVRNYTLSGGTLEGAGGIGSGAYGIYTTGLTQTGGHGVFTGGSDPAMSTALGLAVFGAYDQQGGDIAATGGSGNRSYGFYATNFNQSSGFMTAEGGAGSEAHGLNVFNTLTQNGGYIFGRGGGASQSYGLSTANLYLNSGTVEGRGSDSADNAHGIYANKISIGGGNLTGTGSSTQANSAGVGGLDLEQDGGYINAIGGNAGPGLKLGQLNQSQGFIRATGGSSPTGYGLWTDRLNIGSELRLERPYKQAASVFVNTDYGLTIGSGSVVVPVIDIGDSNGLTSSGLIQTAAGNTVTIGRGARVEPWFEDHRSLTKGSSVQVDNIFIDTGGGHINGEFINSRGGLTIVYTVSKTSGNSRYVISYHRENDVADILPLVRCDNARQLLAAFDDLYSVANDDLIKMVIASIDHSQDIDDLNRRAAWVGLTLTPQAYTKLTHTQHRVMDVAQRDFNRQIKSLSGSINRAPSAGEASSVQLWVNPLYQKSNRFCNLCYEFDSPKEELKGAAFGLGRDFGQLSLGLAFNLIDGQYDSAYSDIDTKNFTLTAGGRLHGLTSGQGWFKPWLSFDAGFGRGNITQHLLNFKGNKSRFSTSRATMFRGGLEAGNDFYLGERFIVSPSLGLEYTTVRQSGYDEEDHIDNLGLKVRANRYESLRPKAGVEFQWLANDNLRLNLSGQYRYETMDRNSSFNYNRVTAPSLVLTAEGEDRGRESGAVGLNLEYSFHDKLSFSAGADFLMEKAYSATAFNAGLAYRF